MTDKSESPHAPSFMENATNTIAEKTAEQLIAAAEKRMKSLFEAQQNIKPSPSSLDILLARYHLEKSLFSRLTDWYAGLTWWQKSGLALTIVGLFAVIGAIVHTVVAACMTGLGILFLWATRTVLNNHHEVTKARDERLLSDIDERETKLAKQLNHVSELETKFKEVFRELCENLTAMNQAALSFEAQVKALGTQIDASKEVNQALQTLNKRLQTDYQTLESRLLEANQRFETFIQTLSNSDDALIASTDTLTEKSRELIAEVNAMTTSLSQVKTETQPPQPRQTIEQLIESYSQMLCMGQIIH